MLSVWLRTLALFSADEKRRIYLLFGYSIVIGVFQLVGILAVMPFIAALTSPDLIQTQPLMSTVYHALGFASDRNFVIALGGFLFFVLVVGNILDLAYSWMSVRFFNLKEFELSTALLESYLTHDFATTRNRNTAELSKHILEDVEHVISGILFSGMGIVNSAISCLLIVGLMLFMDPVVTLCVAGVFFLCYGAIFLLLSPRIQQLGKEIQVLYAQMYVSTQQALDGLKEIKAHNNEAEFIRKYAAPRNAAALNCIRFATMEMIPAQLLEMMGLGSVIAVSLFYLYEAEEPGLSYSMIAMFAFATYRIIPMIKEVFDEMESFAYYRTFLDNIWLDLARAHSLRPAAHARPVFGRLERIELQDIHYQYASQSEPALRGISLTISHGERLCLIGPSGAGKTTTVDILLGLLIPQSGRVLANGKAIEGEEYARVRDRIGYVPQDPYLLDDTLANNIMFGEEPMDVERMAAAYEAAGLLEVFGPFGQSAMNRRIGQHGGRLSGGQRQRIALARALYKAPDVLVLDESTNGLDLVTEQQFLGRLEQLAGVAIIFVSHRPTVMQACRRLAIIDKGEIVAHGSYETLRHTDARYFGKSAVGR